MKKNVISSNKAVTLLTSEQVISDFGEAVASVIMENPAVMWAKFVLTDALPNGNGMRIPKEEFANIIRSGVHMPVKMVEGSVENHEGSKPLGVITHLIESEDKILALAALWYKERPSDVNYIKDRVKDKEPVDVSWEISYDDYVIAADGILNLYGTSLSAATIVKNPAYEGRTPFLAVAGMANKWSNAYISNLPDSAFLYVEKKEDATVRHFPIMDKDGNLDAERLSKLEGEIAESGLSKRILESVKNAAKVLSNRFENETDLESLNVDARLVISSLDITEDELDELQEVKDKVAVLKSDLETATSTLVLKDAELTEKETALSELQEELTELREYKEAIEAEAAKAESIEAIKTKFKEAGIEKEDSYFEENMESLLSLEDSTLDFMLQEMVSFSSKEDGEEGSAEAGLGKSNLPNFKAEGTSSETDPKELAKALRERNTK